MTKAEERYLIPDWPAPKQIQSCVTLRQGGHSKGNFSSFNLGENCGDEPEALAANRQQLNEDWGWSHSPQWLKQVHGIQVVTSSSDGVVREGDASWTDSKGLPCVVTTADCLPVIFCNQEGTCVAAAHAGWKGLAGGVLESTIAAMKCEPESIMAWMGPAISQKHFEVGPEVRQAFIDHDSQAAQAFIPGQGDRWYGDLYQLAKQRLQAAGVSELYGGGFCTYDESDRWFSYRRDGKESGRLATLIWIAD